MLKNLPNHIKLFIDNFSRQALHSSRINFKHPITNDVIDIVSTLPEDLRHLDEVLRNGDKKRNLLPVITSENDVYPYLKKISQFPLLTNEEEKNLAYKWVKDGDIDAAQKLVTSHLRLVAKIAMGYKVMDFLCLI